MAGYDRSMTAIQPRMKAALRGLVSACPPDCRPVGWACVQLALLMLPSSSLIAGVLLLIAITIQRPVRQPAPLSRPQARWLLLLSALMVVGGFWAVRGWVAWVGLFNWLPFFWLFLAIQPYLATPASRTRLGQWILAGTVPVIAVSLIQKATGYAGLLESFWGLIRWPMGQPETGAALFDNANVTGSWLAVTLPFLAVACLGPRQAMERRLTAVAITLGSTIALVITNSRNAMAAVPVIWALSCGRRGRLAVLLVTLGYGALVLLKLQHGAPALDPVLDLLVPDRLIGKVLKTISERPESLRYANRSTIFAAALGHIDSAPWFGLGENGFSLVYARDVIRMNGALPPTGGILHSHNLWLEFAVSHGLPALVLLMSLVGRSVKQALPLLWTRAEGSDRAWLLATLAMLWVHLWDIPSFDARINVLDWLLVAGIACIACSRPVEAQPHPMAST